MSSALRSAMVMILAALMTVAVATSAHASGFAAARFGGEHGHPMADNPSALYYNPAGIALIPGHHLLLDVAWVYRTASYDRPAEALTLQPPTNLEVIANTGEGTLSNFALLPFAGFTTDFGLDIPLAIGVSFSAPFGGSSAWDSVDPIPGAPGAEDGPQRWYTIDGTLRSLATTLGVAYRIDSIGLSIGLSGNLYLSSMSTVRARNSAGSDSVTSGGFLLEGRSFIEVSSTDIGLGAGLIWQPVDNVWIGASYQSQPGFGNMVLEGQLVNLLSISAREENDVALEQALPDVLRLGARFRPVENLELRVFGDFTRWSSMEQQCLVNADAIDSISTICQVDELGVQTSDDPNNNQLILNLIRRWDDTFGVRIGASYFANEDIEVFLGGGYDGNAIPDGVLEPAIMDFEKFTIALGTYLEMTDFMGARITLTEVLYNERDTRGVETAERFQAKSKQPGSQGIYNQNIFLLDVGLEFNF